jgi:hypothetical protein
MNIAIHISFFYIEERFIYLNRIIEETNIYDDKADIFIHTNKIFEASVLKKYTNGTINIVYHDLMNEHPYYLTWKCRKLMYEQRNKYDVFMYIEDDILVPSVAIHYWKTYNQPLINRGYNLGFLRIETKDNQEYITDFYPTTKFNKTIIIDNIKYCINDINPYCAFWIYNKEEFNRFVESEYYNINNIMGYQTREQSSIGLHGLQTNWYKGTLIPIIDNNIIKTCKIYHLPNNYANDITTQFGKLKFEDCIEKSIL